MVAMAVPISATKVTAAASHMCQIRAKPQATLIADSTTPAQVPLGI